MENIIIFDNINNVKGIEHISEKAFPGWQFLMG
jgi:hypothetical protein